MNTPAMETEMDLIEKFGEALENSGYERVGPGNTFRAPDAAPAEEGHNANATDDRLRLLIERVERLEEEKKAITDDIKDVFAEAKGVGYDTRAMKEVIKLRKMSPDDYREWEAVREIYKSALGLV